MVERPINLSYHPEFIQLLAGGHLIFLRILVQYFLVGCPDCSLFFKSAPPPCPGFLTVLGSKIGKLRTRLLRASALPKFWSAARCRVRSSLKFFSTHVRTSPKLLFSSEISEIANFGFLLVRTLWNFGNFYSLSCPQFSNLRIPLQNFGDEKNEFQRVQRVDPLKFFLRISKILTRRPP